MTKQRQWCCLIQVNNSFTTSGSAFDAPRRGLLLTSFRTFHRASRGGRCLIGQVGPLLGIAQQCPTASPFLRLLFSGSRMNRSENIVKKPALIADLQRLQDEIDEALIRKPANDPMTVEFKRRKLHLRDEIELLLHESTECSEYDELLGCRMAMLGLDPYVIESGDRETFDQIKRSCTSCDFREA